MLYLSYNYKLPIILHFFPCITLLNTHMPGNNIIYGWKNIIVEALAGVAQWTECQPANRRIAGLIPRQGMCLGWGHMRGNHTLVFLSLSFFLPSPLSGDRQIKKKKKRKERMVFRWLKLWRNGSCRTFKIVQGRKKGTIPNSVYGSFMTLIWKSDKKNMEMKN